MTECLLKLCAHRALDGTDCKAPAMRQSDYCRHHKRVHRPPFPEYVLQAYDRRSFLLALQRTMQDLHDGNITCRRSNQIVHELSMRSRALTTTAPPSPPPSPANPHRGYR